MKVVFLVPRRADGGPRDRLWGYARDRWARYFPDVEIVEGHHDGSGPFNRSAAINTAADEAGDWDLAVVIDSDVLLSVSQVRAAIDRAATTGRVTWAHRRWRGIRERETVRLVDDARDLGPELSRDELDLIVERTNPLSWSCCFVVPRAVFDDLGGFDERFRGWGWEDMAFQSVVVGLYGHERIEGDVVHLWHPRSEERIVPGQPRTTATPEYVTNALLGRRYMLALRRDYNRHDRGDDIPDQAERDRDIANLRKDDVAFRAAARQLGLPDWSRWWPTLEELRDGARAARSSAPTGYEVSVVLRTGGDPDRWPERREYLERSLASFAERVSGPIVQRVIYSDWGTAAPELEEIAGRFGFYVAGEGHHGYTESMRRLWRYLSRRAVAPFVFLAEDDFVYDRDVDLAELATALDRNPHVRQIALLRGAFYPREIEAGGVLESIGVVDPAVAGSGSRRWIEHRDHFTANPSLVRRSIVATPWPAGKSSERAFGNALLRDQAARFAYWGDGSPWITHIGSTKAATVGSY